MVREPRLGVSVCLIHRRVDAIQFLSQPHLGFGGPLTPSFLGVDYSMQRDDIRRRFGEPDEMFGERTTGTIRHAGIDRYFLRGMSIAFGYGISSGQLESISFWLIPRTLAGRAGPDRAPWRLELLRSAGIGAVLSVNDGLLCHPQDFRAQHIAYACVPLSPNAPPQPGDEEACLKALPLAYSFVQEQVSKGRATMVHCSSGKDRTGLFLAYYLVRGEALTVEAAIGEVRRVRPIAFSAPGWDEFAVDVLRRMVDHGQ